MVVAHLKDVIQGKTSFKRKRSSKWPSVRKSHLEKHPVCAVCGTNAKLEVHHIKSFSEFPELELDPNNLLTLCESKKRGGLNCHLIFGHLANYKNTNPNVKEDVEIWREKLKKPQLTA